MKDLYRKDWILFEELANEGGKLPKDLLPIKIKYEDPETNKHVPFVIKVDDVTHTKYIKHHETPDYIIKCEHGTEVEARAFCNLHGLFAYKLR